MNTILAVACEVREQVCLRLRRGARPWVGMCACGEHAHRQRALKAHHHCRRAQPFFVVVGLPGVTGGALTGGMIAAVSPGASGRSCCMSSDTFLPVNDSMSAGTCATICAMSAVILLTPALSPPVDTTVMRSTLLSGSAKA